VDSNGYLPQGPGSVLSIQSVTSGIFSLGSNPQVIVTVETVDCTMKRFLSTAPEQYTSTLIEDEN
jgi:hypothetical protein